MTKVERVIWLSAGSIALAAGSYFRISGFNTWPLAVDEYYIYRSMTFIFESGLPRFPCGGYYARGLIYQYITVPFLYFGSSPEAALRIVSIICNFLTLPAAFLLAHRIGGLRIAIAVLIVVALSTWEIEMSRFGRMYSAFQLIFMWYVYHAYQLITDRDLQRWRWLFALSIIGPLVWEGAILLSLFNLVLILVDRKCGSLKHIVSSLFILVANIGFLVTPFRSLGSTPFENVSTQAPALPESEGWFSHIAAHFPIFFNSPTSIIVFGVLLSLLALFIYRAHLNVSFSGLETLVLVVSCIALFTNQLLLIVFFLTGAWLVGWIRPQILEKREVKQLAMMMSGVCVYIVVSALFGDYSQTAIARLRLLISFPDIINTIVYPWLYSIPLMTVVLAVSACFSFYLCVKSHTPRARAVRLLITFVLVSVAVIGSVPTPYRETRYSFFLYPVIICIAGYAFTRLSAKIEKRRRSLVALIPTSFVILFLISSDFAIAHLIGIDSFDANFRIGYSNRRTRHYYPRLDYRSAAEYVNANSHDQDQIITSSVVAANYLDRPGFVYIDKSDRRHRRQVCPNGIVERWTGLTLLSSISELTATISADEPQTSWIIVDQQLSKTPQWEDFLQRNDDAKEVFRSRDFRITVYVFSNGNFESL